MTEEAAKEGSTWVTALRAACDALPADYPARYQHLEAIRRTFLAEMTTAISGPLNAHVQNLPHESLDEKRALAATVNQDLRQLNLTLRCPVTRRPAILVADAGYQDRSSQFRFQSFDEAGHRWRKGVSRTVPTLELMEAPLREEGLANRYRRPDDTPGGRTR